MSRSKHKRKGKLKGLEKKVEFRTDKEMNDFCPYIQVCLEPYCFDKFGRYETCKRYQSSNPRTNPNQLRLYTNLK